MRELFFTPQFRKDLKGIPEEIKKQADGLLLVLRKNPVDPNLGVKKLKISFPAWRIRIGVYRLVYSFDRSRLILHRLRHRKNVYKNL
ncbi:MAG: type II toxin-antitoxin system RelE/ParE family toxin [Candidatus Doudnabacteria bacterium]|nr:type II toxin-antitoxin system RelE/ParE family toxin [Candidatus Doudnabacteria bacterium]